VSVNWNNATGSGNGGGKSYRSNARGLNLTPFYELETRTEAWEYQKQHFCACGRIHNSQSASGTYGCFKVHFASVIDFP